MCSSRAHNNKNKNNINSNRKNRNEKQLANKSEPRKNTNNNDRSINFTWTLITRDLKWWWSVECSANAPSRKCCCLLRALPIDTGFTASKCDGLCNIDKCICLPCISKSSLTSEINQFQLKMCSRAMLSVKQSGITPLSHQHRCRVHRILFCVRRWHFFLSFRTLTKMAGNVSHGFGITAGAKLR